MVSLKFAIPRWDPDARRMEYRPVAEVWVNGPAVHIEGDASVFDTAIPLIEPGTGERLTFEPDPERWARALPSAYRSGQLEVTAFVHADSPVPAGKIYA